MNNRLTIQDLAGLLAEYTGKDKQSTERFLREFIVVISEGVYTDKLVKVKGLGTFKIVLVEKRESIHVNTGERFLIPAHYKFSFLPDKDLREQVNKPFSFFETTELQENVDFSDLDVVSDEQEDKDIETESVEEVIPEESTLELVEVEITKSVQQQVILVSTKQNVYKSDFEEQISTEKVEPISEFIGNKSVKQKYSYKKPMIVLAIISVLLLLFNVYLYLKCNFIDGEGLGQPTVIERPVAPMKSNVDSVIIEALSDSSALELLSDTIQEDTAQLQEVKAQKKRSEVIAEVKIERGSRLTLIALKYYGHKLFWVYLYEYNKAVIEDPNNIPIGTVIKVPDPEKYHINRSDRSALEKAASKQTEILNGLVK